MAKQPRSFQRAKAWFAVPAVLTLGLAMRHEPAYDAFEFPLDIDADRRIDAYLPVVRLTEPFIESAGVMDPEVAERLASTWIAEAQRGALGTLRPIGTNGSVFEGAPGQILRAKGAVANSLVVRGENRMKAHRYREGAEDLVLAMKLYRPTLYSSFETVSLHGLQIRRSVHILERAKPLMAEADRQWLTSELRDFSPDPKRLAETAVVMRHLFEQAQWRKGHPVTEERPRLDQPLGHVPDLATQIADLSQKPAYSPFLQAMKRVVASEATTQRRLTALTQP